MSTLKITPADKTTIETPILVVELPNGMQVVLQVTPSGTVNLTTPGATLMLRASDTSQIEIIPVPYGGTHQP